MANLSDSCIDLEVRTCIANKALELANAWMELGSYKGRDMDQREFLFNKAMDLQGELRRMAISTSSAL